jgi:hypothetical protein
MKTRMLQVAIAVAALIPVVGCGGGASFNTLATNVWKGFGYALGGIPAQIVADLISGVIPA